MFQLMRMLQWLHAEMTATQAAAQDASNAHAVAGNGLGATPSASTGALAPVRPLHSGASNGALQEAEQQELDALKARRHLHDCSVLAERLVAAILQCLHDTEARVEAAADSMGDGQRALIQELLQDVIALTVRICVPLCRRCFSSLGRVQAIVRCSQLVLANDVSILA